MFLGTLTLKPDRVVTLRSLLQDLLVSLSSEAPIGDHCSDGWSLPEKV